MITKEIPGLDGFYCTEDGRVFEESTGRFLTIRPDLLGYHRVSIRGKNYGVHRLVALAFHENDNDLRTFVNHIDAVPSNNHADNLDWVTSYENNIHIAILDGNPVKPVLLGTPLNKDIPPRFFQTHQEAMQVIGIKTFKELWFSVKYRTPINGWELAYNDKGIPESIRKYKNPFLYDRASVKFLDVDSGEVIFFNTLRDAAMFLGTTPSLIFQTISTKEKVRLCWKQYIVVRGDDEFPEISDEIVDELRQHLGRQLMAMELSTGRVYLYETAKKFYLDKSFNKPSVTNPLAAGKIRNVGGFIFTYIDNECVNRLIEFRQRSSAGELN